MSRFQRSMQRGFSYELVQRYPCRCPNNGLMTHDELPPIEYNPPFSMEFVAHLHGGCYDEDIAIRLLSMARQDRTGQHMLDMLNITRLGLARLSRL